MKTLGIIGGIGPESTIEYYRAALAAYRDRHGEADRPSVLINSIDVTRVLRLVAAPDHAGLTAYLLNELRRLESGGVHLALLAANTPHVVFDLLAPQSPVPLLSIVEATCQEAQARGLKRLGLLGTRFTMEGRFYPDVFARHGLDIVAPLADEQAYVHEKYTTELLRNLFLPRTRDGLMRLVGRLHERNGVDAVILGGTELPLVLGSDTESPVPLLDTTHIHARAAVQRLWP